MRWEATVKFNDGEEEEVSGVIFSDEEVDDEFDDCDVFFYAEDEGEMERMVGQEGCDFTLFSYERI